jgi:hypothetical protein
MWSECFTQWLVWLCTRSEKRCDPTEAAEIGHAILKSKYDWIIRIRPDIEMVYSIPWPPLITGDVMAQLNSGNYDAYPWAKNLTTNYLASAQRSLFVSKNGCIPSTYNKPCFDISDQVALMKSSVAHVYFGYPASKFLDFRSLKSHEKFMTNEGKASLRESCQFSKLVEAPFPAVLNNRLRREAVTLGPIEFPFIVHSPTKSPLKCSSTTMHEDFKLVDCFSSKLDKQHISKDNDIIEKYRQLKFYCFKKKKKNN